MDAIMKRKPSTEATAAWIRLMRVQSRVLDVRGAGFEEGRLSAARLV